MNYGNNRNLIDFDCISLNRSIIRGCTNKYNNLAYEDVQKLLHII